VIALATRHAKPIRVRVAGDLRVDRADLGEDRLEALRARTELPNPAWARALRRTGRAPFGVPRALERVEVDGDDVVIPRGLGPELAAVGGSLDLEDRTIEGEPAAFVSSRELRAYQAAAVEAIAGRRLGIVSAPTGSGKTTIGLAALSRVARRALVVVPTRDLVEQWAVAAREILGVESGVLAGGARVDLDASVLIATPRGALARASELAEVVGVVVVDEAHRAAAPTYRALLRAIPARRRWGLTGTAERGDGLWPLVEGELGSVVHEVRREDLEGSGALLAPEIVQAPTDYTFTYRGPADWPALLVDIAANEGRNRFLADLVERELAGGRIVLVLVQRVDHADHLAELLAGRGRRARAVHGGRPARERTASLDALRRGELEVITATSIADEGLDIPSLGALILAAPAKVRGRLLQRIGRVVRPAPGKPRPRVIDVVDMRVGVLGHQARVRLGVFRSVWPGVVPRVGGT